MQKILLYILALSFTGCSFAKYPTKWEKEGIYTDKKQIVLNSGNKNKSIKAYYSGAGGVVLDFGKEVVTTDPYFSNSPFFNIMLAKIRTRPEFVDLGVNRISEAGIDPSKINHVLIAHSHYDHLMDLPYLYKHHLNVNNLKIYGSTSSYNALKAFLNSDTVFYSIDNLAYKPNSHSNYEWIYLSDQVRVLPVESSHAPHFLNIRLMEGEIDGKGIKNFNEVTNRTRAKHWKSGKVFSFLIDYLSESKISLRIFIQSSSCAPLAGIPPQSILQDKKVDIAFIGVASTQNTKDYPQTLLKALDPEKVILIHWEDFFRPYNKPPKTVRLTNFGKFFKRIKSLYNVTDLAALSGKVIMPAPGTIFYVNY